MALQNNLQYNVLDVKEAKEGCKNPMNTAEFWWMVVLKRKSNRFLIQTYIPTTLIVVVSWASLLIPPTSYPGRTGLLAGLVLCLINILLNVLSRSPYEGGPDQLTCWLVICIVMVGITFMEYCVVLFFLRHKRRQVEEMNRKVLEIKNDKNDEKNDTVTKDVTDIMDKISLFVIPCLFILTAIIYFAMAVKSTSPDANVVKEAKSRFEKACLRLW